MSYSSLLNETNVDVDNLASDTLSIANSFSSIGSTTINNTILTGSLSGLATSVANGSDLTYTYNPTTKTFTIQINNNSITPSKLLNASLILNGTTMTLGGTYTIPLLSITNGMLAGSISLSNLTGALGNQIIVCNSGTGVPTYVNISGDITTLDGVMTIGSGKVSNTKLQYSSISLNGSAMSLGGTYTIPTLTNGTAQYQTLLTGVSPFSPVYSTLNTSYVSENSGFLYYTTARAQTDAKTSISVVSTGSEISASYLGGVITIPAITANIINISKILKGTANQFLQTSSALVNTWTSMTGDGSLLNGVMTIGAGAVTISKIASSVYSTVATASTLVQRDVSNCINTLNLNLTGSISAFNIFSYINTTFPVGQSMIAYYDVQTTVLNGLCSPTSSSGATWDRVAASNYLENYTYSKSLFPTFKIEGQLSNYFNTPNSEVSINIGVFKNGYSTPTANTSLMVCSTFVNRNILGGNTTYQTPFVCLYTEATAAPAGTRYLFTVYTQTGGAGVCNVGRASNDIQSNIIISQIN